MSELQTVKDYVIPHICAVCKQKIMRGTPHYVSGFMHPKMFYPRVHVEELNALEHYEAIMRQRVAQYKNPNARRRQNGQVRTNK